MTISDRKSQVSYFIFDIETIGDGDLIGKVRYPNDELTPEEALARYRAQLLAETGKDVLPVTFVLPISVAVAKVDADYFSHSFHAPFAGSPGPGAAGP